MDEHKEDTDVIIEGTLDELKEIVAIILTTEVLKYLDNAEHKKKD